jgi:MFS family permease
MTRRPASFGAALASSWALLLGFGILMLGDGLQGTLLAVRADSSAAILMHALIVTVPAWIAMRLISGFCFAGLYIVAESWLNDRADNESRGRRTIAVEPGESA